MATRKDTGDRAFAVAGQGSRDHMEDEHVLLVESADPLRVLGAVFDGHRGGGVSRLARERFPALFREHVALGAAEAFRRTFACLDEEAASVAGGAAAAAFYLDGGEVTVANAGDAHVAHVTPRSATRLTDEHRLSNPKERRRIDGLGAAHDNLYVYLPGGDGLMVTRALGDREFRPVGVLGEPVVSSFPVRPGFLVAGSDGLWDAVGMRELSRLLLAITTARSAAKGLARLALEDRAGGDNVTVLAVRLD